LKRVETTFSRVNNIQKPKEKKPSKISGKNIKIDNMTFNGDSDINWEDFVNINNGGEGDAKPEP
jgi:hypothetical protein